jgi:hypothetical protein
MSAIHVSHCALLFSVAVTAVLAWLMNSLRQMHATLNEATAALAIGCFSCLGRSFVGTVLQIKYFICTPWRPAAPPPQTTVILVPFFHTPSTADH